MKAKSPKRIVATMKIAPIEYALFCDYASLGIDGKLNLGGMFERILTEQVPARHAQMYVIVKMIIPKGKHRITFTLMQQDKVLSKSTVEKDIDTPLSVHTHFWGIQNLNVETWDPIELQILIDGKQVYVKRLPVVKVKKKV